MTQYNNNLSVLPFYTDINEQHHFKPYAYGNVYPLYCPLGSVPPFQIIKPHNAATIQSVMLVEDGGTENIKAVMQEYGLAIVQFADYDVIVWPTEAPHNITQAEGQHYIILTLSDGTIYYSDYFTVSDDMSGYLQIQWWDMDDLIMDGCRIVYSHDYRNTLWLATQLGRPEYEYEEEGETRDGYFFPEKMISQKRYKCVFVAPEYLCDVMRFIRLSDFIRVRDRYGNVYKCDTFLVTPEWQEQGDLASVEIEFTCDTVAKKIGRGVIYGDNGDFNNDYNNDYYNSNSNQ